MSGRHGVTSARGVVCESQCQCTCTRERSGNKAEKTNLTGGLRCGRDGMEVRME